MKTIVWRQEWERPKTTAGNELLTDYNAEDCQTLEVVSKNPGRIASKLSANAGNTPSRTSWTRANLKREHPYGFKRNTFAFPELNVINNAAYWDYQRERIYVKSHGNHREVGLEKRRPPVSVPQ